MCSYKSRGCVCFSSKGSGDLNIKAEVSSLVSEPYTIEDCRYYNDGTVLDFNTTATVTTTNGYLQITTSTNGEKYVKLPVEPSASDEYIWSTTVQNIENAVSNAITLYIYSTSKYGGYDSVQNNWFFRLSGSTTNRYNHSISNGDVVTIKRQNGTTYVYVNDDLLTSENTTYSNSYYIGYYTNKDRLMFLNDIKLKVL